MRMMRRLEICAVSKDTPLELKNFTINPLP
jgi:hypothetical protein